MKITWSVSRAGTGWAGTIVVPLEGGPAVIKAAAPTKAAALGKAAALANQLAESPVLQAIMPPQAALAIKGINVLAKSAAAGKLGEALGKVTGPAVKRLGKVLGF